ncbi:MAG: hypothetical protein LBS49_07570 [Candidatus Accumulibacter sp.]|jgi:hypothetical protein|nr:hypothetical protein [Accumulibacter sp.]
MTVAGEWKVAGFGMSGERGAKTMIFFGREASVTELSSAPESVSMFNQYPGFAFHPAPLHALLHAPAGCFVKRAFDTFGEHGVCLQKVVDAFDFFDVRGVCLAAQQAFERPDIRPKVKVYTSKSKNLLLAGNVCDGRQAKLAFHRGNFNEKPNADHRGVSLFSLPEKGELRLPFSANLPGQK